ncbi:MAG: DUF3592 domain-containing protein [Polyangiaceae bacterium]
MFTKIFVLLLGLAMMFAGYGYAALAGRMRNYKSVTGRVIKREVVIMPTGNTRTAVFGDGGGYQAQVTYRYVVDGVEHESNKSKANLEGWNHSVAERKLAEIPDDVLVWYDPFKPTDAYLHKHGGALGCGIMAFASCLVVGAVIGFFA